MYFVAFWKAGKYKDIKQLVCGTDLALNYYGLYYIKTISIYLIVKSLQGFLKDEKELSKVKI